MWKVCDALRLYIKFIRNMLLIDPSFTRTAKKRGISSLRSWIKHSGVTAIRSCSETKQPCGWGPFPCTVQRRQGEGGDNIKKLLTCCVLMQFTVAMTSVVTSVRSGIGCLDAGTSPRNIQRVSTAHSGDARAASARSLFPPAIAEAPSVRTLARARPLSSERR